MYREMLHQSVADLIEPLLQTQGFELVELQLQQRKGQWLVRVFADAEGGISLADCRKLSLEIGQVLDAEDLVAASYVLEVSSPGLTTYTGRVAVVTEGDLILHVPPDTPLTIPLPQIDHGVVELEFK